jgi:hypothetical protein
MTSDQCGIELRCTVSRRLSRQREERSESRGRETFESGRERTEAAALDEAMMLGEPRCGANEQPLVVRGDASGDADKQLDINEIVRRLDAVEDSDAAQAAATASNCIGSGERAGAGSAGSFFGRKPRVGAVMSAPPIHRKIRASRLPFRVPLSRCEEAMPVRTPVPRMCGG